MRRYVGKFWLFGLFFLFACSLGASRSSAEVSLDDLWAGRAHFQQVGELRFGDSPRGGAAESSSWFTARNGIWYAFNRATVSTSVAGCAQNHTRVLVRQSADKGKTWSAAVVAVEPGESPHGDGCAVLDGSTYYDKATGTWHMLAQCLDRTSAGGWQMCHYTRKGESAYGPFVADPLNPVVRGGELWSRICAGAAKACPQGVRDEGTPDIVSRQNGSFIVTFHGYDPSTGHGYRGVAATPDFHNWQVAGNGLPGDAFLGPQDCRSWLGGCAGVGEAATIDSGSHRYTIAEAMNGSLLCTPNQKWVFALFRSEKGAWHPSGDVRRRVFRAAPLLNRTWADPNTGCALQYARWLKDGSDIYLIYEDWEPRHAYLHRRLLKLVPGGGNPLELR